MCLASLPCSVQSPVSDETTIARVPRPAPFSNNADFLGMLMSLSREGKSVTGRVSHSVCRYSFLRKSLKSVDPQKR